MSMLLKKAHTLTIRHIKNNVNVINLTLDDLDLLKTFQNLSVSSPAPVTMASPSGDTACRGREDGGKIRHWLLTKSCNVTQV